ncbi:MAG TPA: ribonuclease P protein component [Patescibacteria group bacterium]|nr:ribonuclease P protein component [Patescibacteria group bacterium]
MLAHQNRLPHSTRLHRGKTLQLPFFLFKYAPNTKQGVRFGVVISKRIDKRATRRNRMRRLLHAYIQRHLTEFAPNHDYLFILKSGFNEIGEVQTDLTSLMKVVSS